MAEVDWVSLVRDTGVRFEFGRRRVRLRQLPGRGNFGFLSGDQVARVAPAVSESRPAAASSFLTTLAAIDRASSALCFRRLALALSNLAIYALGYLRKGEII